VRKRSNSRRCGKSGAQLLGLHGGGPRAYCTRGRVPLGLGVLPYRVLARYTHSKPRLVLHLPIINEKWLVALHLKNGE